ncbi:hypothetical protein A6J42_20910 [Leptospira interrogans serovar Copenhageni]|nr:hypothetical protein A6J42_20910 [Leptospira interrogans serovar Copenhageni]KAA5542314.1 hypothetical protein F3G11_19970 [Leptospira interrogans serovar Copenhageni]NUL43567.1 hypothetical protein [Leptospira interrogans serovar Copenhageni]QOI47910.1 hypothetical protein Lepto898_15115 [Leptospira interrogans serovar Icterohaemorrhagiae]WPM73728.1 hypothetical protein FYB70_15115 [Leptospira interrogans serovar Icterohaemorrhagiae]
MKLKTVHCITFPAFNLLTRAKSPIHAARFSKILLHQTHVKLRNNQRSAQLSAMRKLLYRLTIS